MNIEIEPLKSLIVVFDNCKAIAIRTFCTIHSINLL